MISIIGVRLTLEDTDDLTKSKPNPVLMQRVRDYLLQPGTPNERLYPSGLAEKLEVHERELLGALAYGVPEGIVELHWEVYCPFCGLRPEEFRSLKMAHSQTECAACETHFESHLDRDVRAPAPDESLSIGRVAILFTDLKDSTAMYAERGDPRAYRLVRDHFAILAESIARNSGVVIKTIGDAVMASFASSEDAINSAFDAQAELQARIRKLGGELVLQAGVHVGPCLVVRLNDRLDFFGGALNTAARVQGLSYGNDVIVSDEVLAEIASEKSESKRFWVENSVDARLRGCQRSSVFIVSSPRRLLNKRHSSSRD